jgi:hypothetical protein
MKKRTIENLHAEIVAFYERTGAPPRTKDLDNWYSWCRKNFIDFRAERDAALPQTVRTEAMFRDEIRAYRASTGVPPTPHDLQSWYHWCGQHGLDFVAIRDDVLGCRLLPGIPTIRTEEMLRADMRAFIAENGRAPGVNDMRPWYQWCARYKVSFTHAREQVLAES